MIDWEALQARMLLNRVALPGDFVGCSQEEIAALEAQFRLRLPSAYREFLRHAGKKAGDLFQGTQMFYPQLPRLRAVAEQLLQAEVPDFCLPDEAFVFSVHQGYEFMYFLADAGEDPPVLQFVEGMGLPTQAWESFSAFVLDSLGIHEQVLKDSS